MKVKHVYKNQNKLIKLQLLKTKSYKKNYFFKSLKIEDIEYRFIKGLKIIYKYNVSRKKLFFFNNYKKIEVKLKNLLIQTTHTYTSKFLRTNSSNKKRNNLIIILNKQINKNDIKKNYNTKIPTIFIGSSLSNFNFSLNYKILGNFVFKKNQNFFFFILLNSIIKKTNNLKNK